MADFAPQIQPTADPNYLNYSGGPSKAQADTSLGDLFKGIGNVVDQGLTFVDEEVKRQTKKIANNEFDKYTAEVGLDTLAGRMTSGTPMDPNAGPMKILPDATQPNAPRPVGLAESIAGIERLKNAVEAGTLSPTYFDGRMTSIAKELRARFPGWRDDIDQQIAHIAGTSMANKLRESVYTEVKALDAHRLAEQKSEIKYIDDNAKWLLPSVLANGVVSDSGVVLRQPSSEATGAPVKMSELKAAVATAEFKDQELKTSQATLTRNAAKGVEVKQEAAGVFTRHVESTTDRVVQSVFGQSGSLKALQDWMMTPKTDAAGKPRPWTPDEKAQLTQSFGLLRAQAELAWNRVASEKIKDKDGNPTEKSYAEMIGDPAKVQAIIQGQKEYLAILEKAANDKDFGILTAVKNDTIARTDQTVYEVIRQHPIALYMKALTELGGANVWQTSIGTSAATLKGFTEMTQGVPGILDAMKAYPSTSPADPKKAAVTNIAVAGSIVGTIPAAEQFSMMQKAGITDAPSIKQHILQNQSILLNPDTTPQMKANFARMWFGEQGQSFMAKFAPKDHLDVLTMLASPEISKSMLALKDAHPREHEMYQAWVSDQTLSTFRQDALSVKDSPMYRQIFDLKMDEKTGTLRIDPLPGMLEAQQKGAGLRPGSVLATVFGTGKATVDQVVGAPVTEAITRLNQALRIYGGAATADGRPLVPELQRFVQQWGLESPQAIASPASFAGMVYDAVGSIGAETTGQPGSAIDPWAQLGKPNTGPGVKPRPPVGPESAPEQVSPVNPLTKKPLLQNPDGTVSSERTITIEVDGKHFIIPTIVDGKQLTNADAVAAWKAGKNAEVGIFKTQAEADAAAKTRTELLNSIDRMFSLPSAPALPFSERVAPSQKVFQNFVLNAMSDVTGSVKKDVTPASLLGRFIARSEVGSETAYNRVAGSKQSVLGLDALSLDDVLKFQQQRIQSTPQAEKDKGVSSAIGKYQIIYSTLKSLKKELGLTGKEKFTPELQDQLGEQLMRRAGLDKYMSGKLDETMFAQNLAQTWASLPLSDGKSYFAGVGANRALVSYQTLIEAVRRLKQQQASQ